MPSSLKRICLLIYIEKLPKYIKNALKIKPTHIGNLKRNIGIRVIGYIGPFHISTISADEKYPDNKFFA